jgi:hypothetical protein
MSFITAVEATMLLGVGEVENLRFSAAAVEPTPEQ